MHTKRLSLRMVGYELRSLSGNMFTLFFGVAFPILMSVLLSKTVLSQVPDTELPKASTGIFITMSMVIPMAVLLIGYAANYSKELEDNIPLRMSLFGFSEKSMVAAKMSAHLIFITGAFILYTVVDFIVLDIQVPSIAAASGLLVSLYALAAIFFMLAHGIALLTKRFGLTYAITMSLYFCFMILCGMMGISYEQMPQTLRFIAKLFPMTYIGNDFIDFWQGGSYRSAALIQSFLLLAAVSGILLFLGISRSKRSLRQG